ncbi:MAG: tRNA (N(6)-L-threonylcarbamoyladenosine(37)-C(2))-methylthiotransferase MtaB [Anaerolineaceae bacterium]|nr:tRNA (N(6)-L-threonylcarbamoyladenosine(37)-C(2))-methylthiotransferase MtaB [Anaerolineaceae bacterium]
MNVYLDMVGCRLNQSEIETIANQFRQAGHTLVGDASRAELVVINTCAVTAQAASDSRQKVRQAARAGSAEIVATGCWATLNPEAAANLPGVKKVVINAQKDSLAADILGLPLETFDLEPLTRTPLPGLRQRTRAFIKVQDGCNNRCTFCVTTLARGPSHSRDIPAVVQDIRAALKGGVREIVLTGVQLGSWGHDLSPSTSLHDLIQAILAKTNVERLRLSSLEPWDVDEPLLALWQNPRMCRHLHLPLQSGSASILRRMARKTTPDSFAQLVALARKLIPEIAITTDVIVGFPGEGEAEFFESLDYVRSLRIAGGHVFTYSPRPETAAARYSDQIPLPTRKQRNAQMRALLAESSRSYAAGYLGRQLRVLWEATHTYGPDGWHLHGLTDNYLKVSTHAPRLLWNVITPVLIEEVREDGLAGAIQWV